VTSGRKILIAVWPLDEQHGVVREGCGGKRLFEPVSNSSRMEIRGWGITYLGKSHGKFGICPVTLPRRVSVREACSRKRVARDFCYLYTIESDYLGVMASLLMVATVLAR
jgi:hypothetical protein